MIAVLAHHHPLRAAERCLHHVVRCGRSGNWLASIVTGICRQHVRAGWSGSRSELAAHAFNREASSFKRSQGSLFQESQGMPIKGTFGSGAGIADRMDGSPVQSKGSLSSSQGSLGGGARTTRNLPKPVACPKPPDSFCRPDSRTSSPASSPTIPRRVTTTTTTTTASSEVRTPTTDSSAPSSPFPTRKASFPTSAAIPHQRTSIPVPDDDGGSDDRDDSTHDRAKDQKSKKSKSVLSILFGKKGGKKAATKHKAMAGARDEENDSDPELTDKLQPPAVGSPESSPVRSVKSAQSTEEEEAQFKAFDQDVDDSQSDPEQKDRLVAVADQESPEQVEKCSLFSDESSEEELLYVPTTLPIEKPIAPVLTPSRLRISEVQVTATQRPRCSITITPCSITDYVVPNRVNIQDRITVKLPKRQDSDDDADVEPVKVVPVKATLSPWHAFAQQGLRGKIAPAAVKSVQSRRESQDRQPERTESPWANWINVDDIPEPTKQAKKIYRVERGGEQGSRGSTAQGSCESTAEGSQESTAQGSQEAIVAELEEVQDVLAEGSVVRGSRESSTRGSQGSRGSSFDGMRGSSTEALRGSVVQGSQGSRGSVGETPEEDETIDLAIARKDSVCSETALLREIDDQEDQDRSVFIAENELSVSARISQSR